MYYVGLLTGGPGGPAGPASPCREPGKISQSASQTSLSSAKENVKYAYSCRNIIEIIFGG